MGNLVSGIIGAAVFIAFSAGLAGSIGTVPFGIIVGSVIIMMLVDLGQSIKGGFRKNNNHGNKT